MGDNADFCVDCVVEEALSRVDAGDAGTEMADLLPPNLLKFALNAVPYEMAHSVLHLATSVSVRSTLPDVEQTF